MPKLPSRRPDTSSKKSSSTVRAVRDLGTARLHNQTSRVRGQLLFGLFHRIPYPIIQVLPFIREDLKSLIQRRWQGQEDLTADSLSEEEQLQPSQTAEATSESSQYLQYCCSDQSSNCSALQQGQIAKTAADPERPQGHCVYCDFPSVLADGSELQGQRGRYQVGQFIAKRGWGRLYQGQDVNRRTAVVIREYLLPRQYFSPTDQRLIRDTFENVAGLRLADGREQDFRLMKPYDVMGDRHDPERCYLITTAGVDQLPTLRTVLTQEGALSPIQVRAVLNQGLQTLTSLHGQKYALPAGQIQTGLGHGNISLDSIVIQPDAASYYESPQLLIFLRDLALWDSLFIPPSSSTHRPPPTPTVANDLVALGQVGLYALLGRWTDHYGRALKPRSFHEWPQQDRFLEQYLRQLLGMEAPTFDTAADARRALLQLPPMAIAPTSPPQTLQPPASTKDARRTVPKWLWLLLLFGLGALSAGLLFRWLNRPALSTAPPDVCCIGNVAAVPPGDYHYASADPGTWYPLWHSRNLVTQNKTLEQLLETLQPDLNLQLNPVATNIQAIAQVTQDRVDFAIAPHVPPLSPDLTIAPIAYDGLAVFVAFSYVERQQGLPHHLQGQLSVDQLRQLYTGEIQNWSSLGGPDLVVKLYLPNQAELIQIFEQRVLKTPEAIQSFRRQWGLDGWDKDSRDGGVDTAEYGFKSRSNGLFLSRSASEINGEIHAPLDMLKAILQDFEAMPRAGSIGFTSLSQIYNQCSVYPLAIAPESSQSAVQPLYQTNGTPISPAVDLCADKGNYGPKQSLFVGPSLSRGHGSKAEATPAYPLAYPLAVLYRQDNSRVPVGSAFAEMMTTDEGQGLLKKTGLIPLYTTW
ncbi:MAG: septum site-determining protein [Cyanobacteria bacterium P01_F01_bin.150]